MRRHELEHVIRASATIADVDDLVVIGSQAVLGSHPDAPAELCTSIEADMYPRDHPERADLLDGSIGEGSLFQDTFGYYVHGVAPETAVLPVGWQERLVPIRNENTRGATGWCLESHDLVIAKLVAGRDKDMRFARVALAEGIVGRPLLLERLAGTDLGAEQRLHVKALLAAVTR